jgi:hypothetical protein
MTLRQRIARRIGRKPVNWVFTPADFLDLATPQAVGMALLRAERAGEVRRIDRGLYDVPRDHPVLGRLHPRADAILAAISRRDGTKFQEHEAMSANELRLTEQVPAKLIYLTPGRSRTIKAGPTTIELRHRSPRKLSAPSPMSARVFAALRNIGKASITPERVAPLRTLLSAKDRRRLLVDLTKAPAWMHPHLREIAEPRERVS